MVPSSPWPEVASNDYEDEYDAYAGMGAQGRVQPVQMLNQVTTKIPPSYDGKSCFFAFEDAIDDWCDITELEPEKRGPALRNRLEGEASIYKRLLNRDRLRDAEDGVPYFKRFLRPYFVKGAQNVFLYRFMVVVRFSRGHNDMLKWMTRFLLQVKRLDEAWSDLVIPVNDVNDPDVQAFLVANNVAAQAQQPTPDQVLAEYNAQRARLHRSHFL